MSIVIDDIVSELNQHTDATDLRVDVFMDRKGHQGRTVLADTEFATAIRGALEYAIESSTANHYAIVRKAGLRLDGRAYVYYTVVLN